MNDEIEIELVVEDDAEAFITSIAGPDDAGDWWNAYASTLSELWETEAPGRNGLIGVVLVGDDRMQEMNRDFRQKDRPTDVLSFDLSDDPDEIEGEVYVGVDRAAAQAQDIGCSDAEELARLVIHGVLHLAGHDHYDPEEERIMLAATDRWLTVWEGHRS